MRRPERTAVALRSETCLPLHEAMPICQGWLRPRCPPKMTQSCRPPSTMTRPVAAFDFSNQNSVVKKVAVVRQPISEPFRSKTCQPLERVSYTLVPCSRNCLLWPHAELSSRVALLALDPIWVPSIASGSDHPRACLPLEMHKSAWPRRLGPSPVLELKPSDQPAAFESSPNRLTAVECGWRSGSATSRRFASLD